MKNNIYNVLFAIKKNLAIPLMPLLIIYSTISVADKYLTEAFNISYNTYLYRINIAVIIFE